MLSSSFPFISVQFLACPGIHENLLKKYGLLDKIRKATPQNTTAKTKKGLTLTELSDFVGLSPDQAARFIEYIKSRGANIYTRSNRIFTRQILSVTRWTHKDLLEQRKVEVFGRKGSGYQFGIISDTHIGSNRTNYEVLDAAYDY